MNKKIFATASLSLCLSLHASAQLPTKEPAKSATGPLVTVNGVAISRQRAEIVMRLQTARGAQDTEQLRTQVREQLINQELINQEAARTGIAKKPEIQQQIDLARQEVIVNAVVGEYLLKHPVTDADIQKEYDRARAQTGNTEYKARHILVAGEDEAKAAIAEIRKGAKFDEVAQKRSTDEGTKSRGGDLDWNVPGIFDKAFADALVKLEKGKMTEAPVRSRFGFHVIQLDDVRQVSFPALAQVKQQIQQRLVQQRIEVLLRELRAKAKIE